MEYLVPCNLCPSFSLLSNLGELPVAVLLIEEIPGFWWLKAVQSPLRSCPLSLSLFFPVVGLGGECSLHPNKENCALAPRDVNETSFS